MRPTEARGGPLAVGRLVDGTQDPLGYRFMPYNNSAQEKAARKLW